MKLPIGISDFRKLRRQGCVFVDKSMAVAEFLQAPGETILITRPRRFGKTINLSMMQAFFESTPAERQELFDGLKLTKTKHMDYPKTPVISLTLKDIKHGDYAKFLAEFGILMSNLYQRFSYLQDDLSDFQRSEFRLIVELKADEVRLQNALVQLTRLLHQHHDQRVMIFLDEYDTPIHEAWVQGYYSQAIDFMRTFLGKALKDNDHLERAMLIGILRVAKESIFSDLNNLAIYTMLDRPFADKFGFTQAEVTDLLTQLDRAEAVATARDWYNGYRVSDTTIYNPWSLIYFAADGADKPSPYWINTSSNILIKEHLLHASPSVQRQVATLLQGGEIEASITLHMSLQEIDRDEDALWSLLLFSGYLKLEAYEGDPENLSRTLTIPNKEVALFFRTVFQSWLRVNVGKPGVRDLTLGLIEGNVERFQHALSVLTKGILSYYDTADPQPERVYHVFVLGLLANLEDRYLIRSNRESGYGRYDCAMIPRPGTRLPGVLIEFKTFQGDDPGKALEAAHAQIENRDYAAELREAGVTSWHQVAIAFNGKHTHVTMKRVGVS